MGVQCLINDHFFFRPFEMSQRGAGSVCKLTKLEAKMEGLYYFLFVAVGIQ